MVLLRVRSDEGLDKATTCGHYNECGCEVSECCLNCPLPVCKYELVQGIRSSRAKERNLYIAHLHNEGFSVEWIVHVLGVSRSTVYAALKVVQNGH